MAEREHEHEFGAYAPNRTVRMCLMGDCTEMRVRERGRWRELTATERVDVIAIMMEDIAIADAMTIIHGKERGMKRAREVLGYGQV